MENFDDFIMALFVKTTTYKFHPSDTILSKRMSYFLWWMQPLQSKEQRNTDRKLEELGPPRRGALHEKWRALWRFQMLVEPPQNAYFFLSAASCPIAMRCFVNYHSTTCWYQLHLSGGIPLQNMVIEDFVLQLYTAPF